MTCQCGIPCEQGSCAAVGWWSGLVLIPLAVAYLVYFLVLSFFATSVKLQDKNLNEKSFPISIAAIIIFAALIFLMDSLGFSI